MLGALSVAVLGLALFATALLDARDLLQGWGTDRLTVSSGILTYPWFGSTLLLLSASMVQERILGRTGSPRLAMWMLGMSVAAMLSIPATYVAGAAITERLEAQGYGRCSHRFLSSRFPRDEWVRGGAACKRDGLRRGAAHDPSTASAPTT